MDWVDHLELFLQWRRITLFAVVQMKFEPDHELARAWREVHREKIDRGEPVFGVNLRRLVE